MARLFEKLAACGGNGGSEWDDGVYDGVSKVYIGLDFSRVTYIKFEYSKGGKFKTRDHGNIHQKPQEFLLNYPNEYITSVEGTYSRTRFLGTEVITSLVIKTSDGRRSPTFGVVLGKNFVLEDKGRRLVGFHGRTGEALDALGAYFAPISSTSYPVYKLESRGSSKGNAWDDGVHGGVRKVYVGRDFIRVTYVRFEYDNGGKLESRGHGKIVEEPKEFALAYPEEYLTAVEGTYSPVLLFCPNFITSLTFKTSKQRTSPTYGIATGTKFVLEDIGRKLVGFHGHEGDALEALGAYFLPISLPSSPLYQLEAKGGNGGIPWDDDVYNGVRKVFVGRGNSRITYVKFEYDKDGKLEARDHGKKVKELNEFVLDYPGEYITSVEGTYNKFNLFGSEVITSLTFKTSKQRVSPTFGNVTGTNFVLEEKGLKLAGFHGRASDALDALGAYFAPLVHAKKLKAQHGNAGASWDDGVYDGIRKISKRTCKDSSSQSTYNPPALRRGAITQLTPLIPVERGHRRGNIATIIYRTGSNQQALYTRLKRRDMLPSRFLDIGLSRVHIYDPSSEFFCRLGWEQFAMYSGKTYYRLTLEFLSSLQYYQPNKDTVDDAFIDFRLCNQEYRLTMRQVAEIFGFSMGSVTHCLIFTNADQRIFWSQIASAQDIPYSSHSSRASSIRHPVLRYAHQILTHTIFGRENSGVVSVGELAILRLGLDDLFTGGVDHLRKLDVSSMMIDHFMRVINSTSDAKICIGGMVTWIARRVGINVGVFDDVVPGPTTLDLAGLMQKLYIQYKRPNYYWRYTDVLMRDLLCRLSPRVTKIDTRRAIRFLPTRQTRQDPDEHEDPDIVGVDTSRLPFQPTDEFQRQAMIKLSNLEDHCFYQTEVLRRMDLVYISQASGSQELIPPPEGYRYPIVHQTPTWDQVPPTQEADDEDDQPAGDAKQDQGYEEDEDEEDDEDQMEDDE